MKSWNTSSYRPACDKGFCWKEEHLYLCWLFWLVSLSRFSSFVCAPFWCLSYRVVFIVAVHLVDQSFLQSFNYSWWLDLWGGTWKARHATMPLACIDIGALRSPAHQISSFHFHFHTESSGYIFFDQLATRIPCSTAVAHEIEVAAGFFTPWLVRNFTPHRAILIPSVRRVFLFHFSFVSFSSNSAPLCFNLAARRFFHFLYPFGYRLSATGSTIWWSYMRQKLRSIRGSPTVV